MDIAFLSYHLKAQFYQIFDFRKLKGEIANSKKMASLRICPRADIRRKKKSKI